MAKTVTMTQLVDEITKDLVALFRGVATEASDRMITKAPVQSGSLRASIVASVNSEAINWSKDTVDPSGSKTKATNAATIKGAKDGDRINIIVGAPYGAIIEGGSSEQAPTGFVLTTGEELSAIVNSVKANLGKYR